MAGHPNQRVRHDRTRTVRRQIALGTAVIMAPFLVVMVLVVVIFAAIVVLTDDEPQRTFVGTTRDLVDNTVPDWARAPLLAAAQTCSEITAPLLAAQIEVESGWNPNAHNEKSGAEGLSQFLPATWREWGRDGDGDGRPDPRSPADAITAQAAYMCHLVTVVGQNPNLQGELLDLALAAYNAGPGNVQKFGGIPPFLETANYIRKVRALADTKYGTLPTESLGDNTIVASARRWIGTPYAWGGGTLNGPGNGQTPDAGVVGFDCSSLVRYAIHHGTGRKVTLPRTSREQYQATRHNPVESDQLQPGDLLFWGANPKAIHHVAIFSGNKMMIEAPESGKKVRETRLRQGGDYLGATRIGEIGSGR